jgi:hypothetical protein
MHFIRRINKYNNRRTRYAGRIYDSALEGSEAQNLDLRKKAGDIKDWKAQVPFEMRVNGMLICRYKVDFVVYHNDGSKEAIETKGFETSTWRLKWKLMEALYGDEYTLTIVRR